MPKMKTNRGAAKRFSATGSGKIKRRRAYLRHILTTRPRSRSAGLRTGAPWSTSVDQRRRSARLLPYL